MAGSRYRFRARRLLNRPNQCVASQAALDQLDLGDELDCLTNPATDHDRHAYLPRKVADGVACRRREIQKAIEGLG